MWWKNFSFPYALVHSSFLAWFNITASIFLSIVLPTMQSTFDCISAHPFLKFFLFPSFAYITHRAYCVIRLAYRLPPIPWILLISILFPFLMMQNTTCTWTLGIIDQSFSLTAIQLISQNLLHTAFLSLHTILIVCRLMAYRLQMSGWNLWTWTFSDHACFFAYHANFYLNY